MSTSSRRQRRLDAHPEQMRQRRETVEHPFGTIKARMGATHFLMKTLQRVRTKMALHVLAYNLTRVINIFGIAPLINSALSSRRTTPSPLRSPRFHTAKTQSRHPLSPN